MAMKNKTRRALVLSVLSLILCCSMLVGTTFAWFTDSVTSGNNVIQSGNLDISMQHARWNGAGYDALEEVANSTGLFLNQNGESILWEPEAEAQEHFKIENKGSLALKYQFKLGYTNATVAPNGKTLADVLDVQAYAYSTAGDIQNDTIIKNVAGVAMDMIPLKDCVFESYLLPGESLEFDVVIKWNQSANDNDYNIAGGMKIDMGVYLLATQHTEEVDVEDNLYDKKATYDASVIPDVVLQGGADEAANTQALTDAINAPDGNNDGETAIILGGGAYTMPSSPTTNEVTITGTKDTVLDVTNGAYMDSADGVTIEGVTIKTGTGKVNGNGSDYAALYAKDVTYKNCTFVGPMRVGRDGAKFINCTFTELGNDYVWTYGNDVTFEGCTFNTNGKAILIYNDGGSEVSQVAVKNCNFNATTSAKASAIANQNCAAIEIDNYGYGVNLITSGNTNDSNFSGEWRIKSYKTGGTEISVNGTKYTTIALDGKIMTIDSDKNVTVQ